MAEENEEVEQLMTAAREVFEEADSNGDGHLDEDELVHVLKTLYDRLGAKITPDHKIRIYDDVRHAIANFGNQELGELGWIGFLRLITRKPWRELLPPDVVNKLPHIAMIMHKQAEAKKAEEAAYLAELQGEAQAEPSASSWEPPPSPSKSSYKRKTQLPQHTPESASAPASKLMRMAKFLFDQADTNRNGSIDPEELGWLIQELWRRMKYQPLPADVRIRVIDEVRACMKKFDLNKDGHISFYEFTRMLTCKPWGNLLPPEARKKLPFVILRSAKKDAMNKSVVYEEDIHYEPGPQVMAQLKKLFKSFDTDQSGELEIGEMMELVEQVWFAFENKQFASREELKAETKTLIERFDLDENGTICLEEFIHMMSRKPFLQMLPKDAKDYFVMESAKYAAEPVKKSQAKAALIAARNLFKAADIDGDGFLEENELANVMQELHRRLGTPMSADARISIVETCRKQIERFDASGAGVLDFTGFARMLTQKPWNNLLDEESARALPFLILKGLKVNVDKNRPEPRKGDELLEFAREIFEKADVDDSGFIDEHELGELLKMIWAKLGRPFGKADKERLRYEVHAAMVNFDVDDSGTISFEEFIMLLSKRPWRLMLPKELQDDLLMRGQEIWAETPPRVVDEEFAEIEANLEEEEGIELGAEQENQEQFMTEEEFNQNMASAGIDEPAGTQDAQLMALMSQPSPMSRGGPRGRPGDKYPKELNRKWPSSLPRPRVYLMRNDGEDPPLQVSPAMVYSIANLLDCAAKQLGLARAARRLFIKATGEEIYYLDQVRNNMELLISMGEDLKTSARPRSVSPKRAPSPPKLRGTGPTKMFGGCMPWITAGELGSNQRVGFEARQAQNPNAATNMKIWPSGIKRPRVIVRHNDGGHRTESYPVLVYSFKNLLDEATKLLNLARCGRRLFTLDGREIKGIEELDNMMELAISEGEAFRHPRNKSARTKRM